MVRIGGQQPVEEVWEGMKELVEGEVAGLGELDEGTGVDWARVDKVCLYYSDCIEIGRGADVRCTKWQR